MEKCWCENFEWDDNGECWDRYADIINHSYPFGIRSEIIGKLILVAPDKTDYVDEEKDHEKFQLNLEVSAGMYAEDIIFDEYVPINYCPFCGRKLEVKNGSSDGE